MKNLLIIGAGQHGIVVKEIAEQMGCFGTIDFLDDHAPIAIGTIADARKLRVDYPYAFVSIGTNTLRHKIMAQLKELGYTLPVIRHNAAVVSPSANVSENVLLCANAVVDTESIVGAGCFLSIGSLIGHHCQLGQCCHIAVGAIVPNNANVPAYTVVAIEKEPCGS